MRYIIVNGNNVIPYLVIVDTQPEPENPSATPLVVAVVGNSDAAAIAEALNASVEE